MASTRASARPAAVAAPALPANANAKKEHLPAAAAFVNPYLGHRNLSETEQQVLGEYARLAATIARIASLSTTLSSSSTHHALLTQLRVLERKMGLVLTLFKASVWSVVMTHQQHLEETEAARAAAAEHGGFGNEQDDGDADTVRGGYGAPY
ncbi:hypothetical protein K437DRAFT_267365 [Tilletiaria anomala UBC 951]|uniref:DASH complex subunit DAD3 n=1 Tax=Tilletiaria anomala (strain ATCC 24038 / CBS 436.72 / UBC 951) TaxID=1037660 RepID=A0A066WFU5_TILAU|nr:uncharacterized protein K437DRAFT_267365 [Tilletiaria anomala UBC 951]KDN49939.1 hypothetical protein K437DRAFT_267365 [Tilletiaria anomala UBC 951]